MISIEILKEPDSNWNNRLFESPAGTVHNTKNYALSINTQIDLPVEPTFLLFRDNKGNIIAQLAITTYPRFHKKKYAKNILNMMPVLKKKVYRWSYGPVIFNPNFTDEVCGRLQDFLISKNCRISGSEHPLLPNSLKNMRNPFKLTNWATYLIDLSEDKKVIWNKMDKHSVRKNIERTENRGVYVRQMQRSDLELYRKLRIEKDLKLGYDILALSTVQKTWDTLKDVGWTGFMAFKEDEPVGAIMITSFNGYINEWGIARADHHFIPKIYPQDLLKWKIIEWGTEKDFRFYDLTGTRPIPINKKEEGILQYKKKWGGKMINYNLINL